LARSSSSQASQGLAWLPRPPDPAGAAKPAAAEPVGASKPATRSEVPAGKIGALAGFETGSWPSRTYRETVSRWIPSRLAIARQDSPADRNE